MNTKKATSFITQVKRRRPVIEGIMNVVIKVA